MATSSTTRVGQSSSGDPVTPRENAIGRGIVEATPSRHQYVAEDVIGIVGFDASADVALKWFKDLVDDGLEPSTTVGCGAHLWVYVRNARDSVI